MSSLERVGVGRKRKIGEEGWSEKLEEDGFNVCASAVLAEESRKDECFVLLSLKSRKKCVQPGHCASVPKVSLAKKCVQSRRAVRTEWVREELCIISKKRSLEKTKRSESEGGILCVGQVPEDLISGERQKEAARSIKLNARLNVPTGGMIVPPHLAAALNNGGGGSSGGRSNNNSTGIGGSSTTSGTSSGSSSSGLAAGHLGPVGVVVAHSGSQDSLSGGGGGGVGGGGGGFVLSGSGGGGAGGSRGNGNGSGGSGSGSSNGSGNRILAVNRNIDDLLFGSDLDSLINDNIVNGFKSLKVAKSHSQDNLDHRHHLHQQQQHRQPFYHHYHSHLLQQQHSLPPIQQQASLHYQPHHHHLQQQQQVNHWIESDIIASTKMLTDKAKQKCK